MRRTSILSFALCAFVAAVALLLPLVAYTQDNITSNGQPSPTADVTQTHDVNGLEPAAPPLIPEEQNQGSCASSGLTTYRGDLNVDLDEYGIIFQDALPSSGCASTGAASLLAKVNATLKSQPRWDATLQKTVGTSSSSRRFKEQIRDMGDSTNGLLKLRPVTYLYKPEYDKGERTLQYGLIAEEVAKVYPELVAYDNDGQPYSVRYQYLTTMLLNEEQKQYRRAAAEDDVIKAQQQEIELLKAATPAEQRVLSTAFIAPGGIGSPSGPNGGARTE